MYHCTKSPFGKYTRWTISNDRGNQLVLLPDFGACMLEARLGGVNILDGYDEPIQVDINKWYKNVLLYPFPNRLKEGRYTWQGKSYQFPINDPQNEAAVHGFGVDRPMEIETLECQQDRAQIICRYDYPGDRDYYPFPFQFRALFEITDEDKLTITLSVTNTGARTIPFGFGWHPYFAIAESIGETQLQLPPCEMIGVDQYMIPTGKRYPFEDFLRPKEVGTTVLDNGFVLSNQEDNATFFLKSKKGTLSCQMETGPDKYQFLQVFTPPYRGAIAIEPMSCNIDAFNGGEGLWKVEPNEVRSASFYLRFSS